jgi:hypothetical protein
MRSAVEGTVYNQIHLSIECSSCVETTEVPLREADNAEEIRCPDCEEELDVDSTSIEELKGKARQFHRLLMSYNDFQQAIQIAGYTLKEGLPEKRKDLRGKDGSEARILWQALNCAMLVAYARPFSGNDKGVDPKIPDLPESVLKVLDEKERKIHEVAISDRDSLLAHSDSSAWNLRTFLFQTGGSEVLVPLHHDVRAPLTRDATEVLKTAAEKLREEVFRRRKDLECELKPHFPSSI